MRPLVSLLASIFSASLLLAASPAAEPVRVTHGPVLANASPESPLDSCRVNQTSGKFRNPRLHATRAAPIMRRSFPLLMCSLTRGRRSR